MESFKSFQTSSTWQNLFEYEQVWWTGLACIISLSFSIRLSVWWLSASTFSNMCPMILSQSESGDFDKVVNFKSKLVLMLVWFEKYGNTARLDQPGVWIPLINAFACVILQKAEGSSAFNLAGTGFVSSCSCRHTSPWGPANRSVTVIHSPANSNKTLQWLLVWLPPLTYFSYVISDAIQRSLPQEGVSGGQTCLVYWYSIGHRNDGNAQSHLGWINCTRPVVERLGLCWCPSCLNCLAHFNLPKSCESQVSYIFDSWITSTPL